MQFYQNLRGLTAGFNCADNKKSQSALEYMMTYGWAILAIVIIIIIFYSLGIFSPTNNLSYSVTGFSPFTILSQECGNGALVLEVGNSAGSPVEILNASVISSNGIKISSLPDINYFAGIDNNFFLTFYNSACKSSDNFYSASITINYAIDTPAGEENLVSRGYIAGKSITQRLITFIESGLPAGLNWTMEYANEIKNSQQGSISFLDLGNQRFYIKNTSINGVTYMNFELGATAMLSGVPPTLNDFTIEKLVAFIKDRTPPLPSTVAYTKLPFMFMVMPVGFTPTVMFAITLFMSVFITDTKEFPWLVTKTGFPLGETATPIGLLLTLIFLIIRLLDVFTTERIPLPPFATNMSLNGIKSKYVVFPLITPEKAVG